MHVSLLISIIMYILNKISYNNYYKNSIITIILMFYLFLTGCSASILRTTIMTITSVINKTLNLKIKKLDIMLLTLIIAIIINPFIIYEVGFQFSYIISLYLNILPKIVTKIKSKIIKNLYISFVCFIVSFPICIYHFYQVNLLSIVLNLIMIPFVSIIIFPLSLIDLIFPIIHDLYKVLISILETINNLSSSIKVLTLNFAKPTILIIIIYYLIITVAIYKPKYFIVLIIIIILHKIQPYINNDYLITTLDQTCPIMIQGLSDIFQRSPLISIGI